MQRLTKKKMLNLPWEDGIFCCLERYRDALTSDSYTGAYVKHLEKILFMPAIVRWFWKITGRDKDDLKQRFDDIYNAQRN